MKPIVFSTIFVKKNCVLNVLLLNTLIIIGIFSTQGVFAQNNAPKSVMEVGVARIDITPKGPIILAGYGERNKEDEGVLQHISAKALAFGSDAEGVSVLITVDLIGIQWSMTKEVGERLSKDVGLDPKQLVICATHIHTGPEIGNLINHFGRQLSPDEIGHIDMYREELTDKIEKVALAAISSRKPSLVEWGQGKVNFAKNRRKLVDGKPGPVDDALPILKISDLTGNLRAVLVSYACHNTTLGGDVNEIHGDWAGEAQRIIEERHKEAIAMVSLGCGADANPEFRLKLEYTTLQGKMVADEVDSLLNTKLQPLTNRPVGRITTIQLPYAHVPSIQEFREMTNAKGSQGYFARLALDKIARGETIPSSLTYHVQTWTFGNDLAMVFLAGEVVVDYELRIKKELGDDKIWVNAYSNDVPCYIASRRVINEGGYEVDYSMYSYNRPSRFSEGIEDMIIAAVYGLLPQSPKLNSKKMDLGKVK